MEMASNLSKEGVLKLLEESCQVFPTHRALFFQHLAETNWSLHNLPPNCRHSFEMKGEDTNNDLINLQGTEVLPPDFLQKKNGNAI
jgi:hypothetical protein